MTDGESYRRYPGLAVNARAESSSAPSSVGVHYRELHAGRKDIVGKARNPDNDAFYVLNLCEEILGSVSEREHRFDWLRGDVSAQTGRSMTLPVDGYWASLGLVVEVMESQHFEATPHFDKPNVMTASGIHRGLQRRLYDARKSALIPKHGLKLLHIAITDFEVRGKKIRRDSGRDIAIVRTLLRSAGIPGV
jgi:hypothetical protein